MCILRMRRDGLRRRVVCNACSRKNRTKRLAGDGAELRVEKAQARYDGRLGKIDEGPTTTSR